MSWTDKEAMRQMNRIRDRFDIMTLVETGTYRGVNAKVQSYNFDRIRTCELKEEYYQQSLERLKDLLNVDVTNDNSPDFLKDFVRFRNPDDCVMYYLDAHFYDPELPPEDRFVVLKELEALKGDPNCVIVIHDFASHGLGHLVYDGIPLNMDLLRYHLLNVNQHFHFYGNTLEGCDIVTVQDLEERVVPGLDDDEGVRDNLGYVWSKPDKTYRGLLYATPKPLKWKFKGKLKEIK